MTDEIHISSLLVHCHLASAAGVAQRIGLLPGTDIHGGIEAGKLIVTLECNAEAEIVACLDAIQALDGVLAATLVFHHVEPRGPTDMNAGGALPWMSHVANC